MVNLSEEFTFLKDENLDPELKKILLQKLLDERSQKLVLSATRQINECTETNLWIAGGWSFPAYALRPFFGSPEAGVFRLMH